MEKRPNVFPEGSDKKPEEEKKVLTDKEYNEKRINMANHVYSTSGEENKNETSAIEQMRHRTMEQIKLRDSQLEKNSAQIQTYQDNLIKIEGLPDHVITPVAKKETNVVNEQPKVTLNTPPSKVIPKSIEITENKLQEFIDKLSQPQYNAAFDLLPLPSEGKIYNIGKSSVKVAYMTAGDENILTSPNLVQSGEFLEILINRKLLEPKIRYRDLHIGDRNAIMLWLRATSYGEMYPVTLLDENNEPFETTINLNNLKIKKLGANPDSEGLFEFTFPLSKKQIKFKLLTVGDVEEIELLSERDRLTGSPIDSTNIYTLERQIIEIDGIRDTNYINDFIQVIRVMDLDKLTEYIKEIESGVELDIEVGTPGGGSIKTFLPLNFKFFWPKLRV